MWIRLIFGCLVIVSILYIVFYVVIDPVSERNTQRTEVIDIQAQITEQIENDLKDQELVVRLFPQDEIEHLHIENETEMERFQQAIYVIHYLFAGSMFESTHIFSDAFHIQRLNDDLAIHDNPDKHAVLKEMMNRISRDKQLIEVVYIQDRSRWTDSFETHEVRLIYKDGQSADVTLSLDMYQSSIHHDSEMLYVLTSAWDIIAQIESQTN